MLATAKIVFFSGTRCTARSADTLRRALVSRGIAVVLEELRGPRNTPVEVDKDLMIIMFPVHTFDAPLPIYEYVDNLHGLQDEDVQKVALIAVSGGGDIAPNRACCWGFRRILEQKGFVVIYESMIAMPCNTLIDTPALAAKALLNKLPDRCDKIASDLVAGVTLTKNPPLLDRFFARVGAWERGYWGGTRFGRKIQVSDSCTSCGWCARMCPRKNIDMVEGMPQLSVDCALCLNCIYGCPSGALSAGYAAMLVLKDGFDLDSYDALPDCDSADLSLLLKGALWQGVREYLAE